MMMKSLGIDHGNARIGIAISDPTGTLARPYQVINHTSRNADAVVVAEIARAENCQVIVVGLPLDADGSVGPRARSVNRFIEELHTLTNLPVIAWDESYSTQDAIRASIARGEGKKKRRTDLDDQAAAIILQNFLDNNSQKDCEEVSL
jgi:putative Holliday junction resolvase